MVFDKGYDGYFDPSRTVQISAGETDSDPIDCSGFLLGSINIPPDFTGTELSFLICDTVDGTYQVLYDDTNTAITLTVAAGRSYVLSADKVQGVSFIKLVSNATETNLRSLVCTLRGTNKLFIQTTAAPSPPPPGAPPFYSNLIMWNEANQGVYQDLNRTIPATMNGDPVLGWKDVSSAHNNWGNDNNFGNQLSNPILFLNAQNGQPSVLINKGSFLFNNDLSLSAYSCFVIAQPDSTLDGIVLLLTSGNNSPTPPMSYFAIPDASNSGNVGFYVPSNANVFISSAIVNTTIFNMIGTAIDDSTNTGHMYINGVDTAQAGCTGCNFNSFSGWPPTNGTFIGQLCAVLIYNRFLSDPERASVEAYLNAKYNIF